nr:response regulator [Terribacillus saccharophilus]
MSKHVLIVDDQPGIRILLEEVIREEGHTVISVGTGAKALDQIKRQKPDLLLIDYKLPVLDGPGTVYPDNHDERIGGGSRNFPG